MVTDAGLSTPKVQIHAELIANGTHMILTIIIKKALFYWALRYLYRFGYVFVLWRLLSHAEPTENCSQYFICRYLAGYLAEIV